jgi:hypothetical protein
VLISVIEEGEVIYKSSLHIGTMKYAHLAMKSKQEGIK